MEAAVNAGAGAVMAADELAKSKGEEIVFGTRLSFEGSSARFFQCTSEESCTERRIEVPASAVVAIKKVGRTWPQSDRPADEATEILRITLTRGGTTSRGGVAVDSNRGLSMGSPTK